MRTSSWRVLTSATAVSAALLFACDAQQDSIPLDRDPTVEEPGPADPAPEEVEAWFRDLREHPRAHADDLEDSAVGPTPADPTTLDERSFEFGGRPWTASLRSYREADLWRGFIAFEGPSTTEPHRTAPLFCERDLAGLLERFASFETATLQAFLRSALP